MALLDTLQSIPSKIGKNLERNIGGLLGEDLSKMSEEERRAVRRQAAMAIFDAMASGTTPTANLERVAAMTGARLEAQRGRERQAAAESMLPKISGRVYGGQTGAQIESLEPGGAATPLTARYVADPGTAMSMLTGTRAGIDAAQLSPSLLTAAQAAAQEAANPDQYVYQNVSGVGLVAVNKKNPKDVRVVQPERARAAGPSERFKILSPAEATAMGLPPGVVYQQNLQSMKISPLEGMPKPGGPSDTLTNKYNQSKFDIMTARGNIEGFKTDLKEIPAYKALTGEGRGRLNSSYTLALSAIRQLQNSGVLNVGELPFLQKALDDPTSISSILGSPLKRKELDGQIATVLRQLNQQERILDEQYKTMGGSVLAQQPPAAGSPSSGPTTRGGRRNQPSAEAVNRAKNYY